MSYSLSKAMILYYSEDIDKRAKLMADGEPPFDPEADETL